MLNFLDFLPDGTSGTPPASVAPSAPTVGHSTVLSIASFQDSAYQQQVDGGSFANLDVGLPTLPPQTQVLAAEAKVLARHNYELPFDVNSDQLISALDVLLVINSLNQPATGLEQAGAMIDVSGDGQVSAVDVLLVVNHLNANGPTDKAFPLRTRAIASDVQTIASALITELASTGLPVSLTERLAGVAFEISNLPENVLAQTRGDTIYIDLNAAGWGWHIDLTPFGDRRRIQALATAATRRVDLLSTIAHELGHVLGIRERYTLDDHIMNPRLRVGQRTVSDEAIRQLLDELPLTW